jgi:hypothetical protein
MVEESIPRECRGVRVEFGRVDGRSNDVVYLAEDDNREWFACVREMFALLVSLYDQILKEIPSAHSSGHQPMRILEKPSHMAYINVRSRLI